MFFFCLVFAMSLCASVYMCFVVTCWERVRIKAKIENNYIFDKALIKKKDKYRENTLCGRALVRISIKI